ncbi:hypothetical protein HUJ04_003075 [Dendroctonus ponderosae]|uniref:Sperm-associated antigen 1 n=1 Tax=Dendroctonus ponderosae TaxID=77166 RepID=A0AAR5PTE2_DENPD|nr:hypothetical protein HUJ04_003075 [Dendroctonus ponderosae]
MTTFDDLQKIDQVESYSYRNCGKESLLAKYSIPLQHLDFKYVATTKDANELEKMVEILRSGQEGHYPELLRSTEDHLRILKPNSRLLRQTSRVLSKQDLKQEEIDEIANELQKFVTDISRSSKSLEESRPEKIRCDVKVRQYEPQPEPLNLVKNEKRIAATDYQAWDKYDPDVELLKQELEQDKIRKQAEKAQQAVEKVKEEAEKYVYAGTSSQPTNQFVMSSLSSKQKKKLKKTVCFNQYPTEAEAIYHSNRELEKGREFFKSADYELALKCFTSSIMSKSTAINLNNRALTYLKLKRFEEALRDVEKVLTMDGKNLKALLRKAQSLEGLKKYEEALDCVDLVIERDPNNHIAQELAERVRQFCRNMLKNTRMKIVEIQ